jgi:hypothetical protein
VLGLAVRRLDLELALLVASAVFILVSVCCRPCVSLLCLLVNWLPIWIIGTRLLVFLAACCGIVLAWEALENRFNGRR